MSFLPAGIRTLLFSIVVLCASQASAQQLKCTDIEDYYTNQLAIGSPGYTSSSSASVQGLDGGANCPAGYVAVGGGVMCEQKGKGDANDGFIHKGLPNQDLSGWKGNCYGADLSRDVRTVVYTRCCKIIQ